jgi:hypothetical protein
MSATEVEAAQDKLRLWYPQFVLAVPPRETAAMRAWLGRIQPFPDGNEFSGVMTHLAGDEEVRVLEGGGLTHPLWCRATHKWPVPFSAIMATSFEVLLLEFPGSRHPRVYGVAPEISRRRFPYHPHFRDDQQIVFKGKPLPALCIYLSSDRVLQRDDMRLVNVLDFTSIFLAKHLFWTATYQIATFSISADKPTVIAVPGALLTGDCPIVCDGTHAGIASAYRKGAVQETRQQAMERLFNTGRFQAHGGTWVGKAAPHLFAEMVREFRPGDECPCGSGLRYGNCHWRQHRALAS